MAQNKTRRVSLTRLQHPLLLSALTGLVVFLVYLLGITPEPVGLNDSDLLLFLSKDFGVLPSPGYPLLTVLVGGTYKVLGTFLPLAYWGHILSALLTALSVSFIFATVYYLYPILSSKRPAKGLFNQDVTRFFVAAIPAFSLAFSTIYWRLGLFFERYTLTLLLMSILIYAVAHFFLEPLKPKAIHRYLVIIGLVLGIGLSHQWVFLIPLLVTVIYIAVYHRDKLGPTSVIASLLVLLLPLLSFGLLTLFNQNQVLYGYKISDGVTGLISFVSQNYFRDEVLETNLQERVSELELRIVLQAVWDYLGMLLSTTHLYIILLSISGFVLAHLKKPTKLYRSWLVFTITLFIFAYAIVIGWPNSSLQRAYVLPLLSYILPFLAIIAAIGIDDLIYRFSNAGSVLAEPKRISIVLSAIIVLPLLVLAYFNYRSTTLQGKVIASEYSQNVFNEVEDNALVFCFSRMSCYNLMYTKEVQDQSEYVIPFYFNQTNINLPTESLEPFSYPTYPWNVFNLIVWNVDDRPVYLVDVFSQYFELLGINYGFVNYIPQNYTVKLDRRIPEELERKDHRLSEQLLSFETPEWDYFLKAVKTQVASRHMMDAVVYMKSNLRELAYRENNEASSLMHQLSEEDKQWVLRERQSIESLPTSEFFELGSEVVEADYVLEQVQELEENGRTRRASEIARGAVVLDPDSIEARLKWADLLAQTYASESAKTEYENILVLDPENEVAPAQIEYLEQAIEEVK